MWRTEQKKVADDGFRGCCLRLDVLESCKSMLGFIMLVIRKHSSLSKLKLKSKAKQVRCSCCELGGCASCFFARDRMVAALTAQCQGFRVVC